METVQASDVWYMNVSYLNDTDSPQPARIRVRDKQNILQKRRPYMIAVTRFTVSGNTTLYYQPANPDAQVSFQFYREEARNMVPTRSFTKSLTDASSTISELLDQLNEYTPLSRVEFSVTSDGRFKASVIEVGPDEVDCVLEISEPLAKILGFEAVKEHFRYKPSYYDMMSTALDWLRIPCHGVLDVFNETDRAHLNALEDLLRLQNQLCPVFNLAVGGLMGSVTFQAGGQTDLMYYDFDTGDTIVCDSVKGSPALRTRSYLTVNRVNAGVIPPVMSFLPVAAPLNPLETSVCFLAQDCFGFTYSARVQDNADETSLIIQVNVDGITPQAGDYIEIVRGVRGVDYYISEIIDVSVIHDVDFRTLSIEPITAAQLQALAPVDDGLNQPDSITYQSIRISRLRPSFAPLVSYPFTDCTVIAGVGDMTLPYAVPAQVGDQIFFADGNQAKVTDNDPSAPALTLEAADVTIPLVNNPSGGNKTFYIYPGPDKAEEIVSTWIDATRTGMRGKEIHEIQHTYRSMYQEIVQRDGYWRVHGDDGNLNVPRPSLQVADVVTDNDHSREAPQNILAPIVGGRLPRLLTQTALSFLASHPHYVRVACDPPVVAWLKIFEDQGVMSGAFIKFSGEVRNAGGNLLLDHNKHLPICITIGDDELLVYIQGSTFETQAHIGLAGGVHSGTGGQILINFQYGQDYEILFAERSYITEIYIVNDRNIYYF